jgi:iron complex transport system substrate-binding protein
MHDKHNAIWVFFLFCIVSLSACGLHPKEVPEAVITITDSLDRQVSLPGLPQRIVIAGKSNFMVNDAVYLFPQAAERVTALTQARQSAQQFTALLDKAYEQKARFTLDSSAEEIASSQPDLVFLKSFMQVSLGESLEALSIPVIYLDLETPEGYKQDIAVLGQIFGDAERAAQVWSYYNVILETVKQAVQKVPASERPTVLLIQYNSSGGQQAFQVPPSSWIQTQIVELAGGIPVWHDAAQGNWAIVNFEQIAAWNPDQIYVLSYFENPEVVVDNLHSDTTWQHLTAVKNGQIFGFPKDYYSWDQPDTRWGLGLLWLAQHIHPTSFTDNDISTAFYQFYRELYGLDTRMVNQHVVPLVQGTDIRVNTAE